MTSMEKLAAMDPVGKEDSDVDNDGKSGKSDKYLMKRRHTIGKAIASKAKAGGKFLYKHKGLVGPAIAGGLAASAVVNPLDTMETMGKGIKHVWQAVQHPAAANIVGAGVGVGISSKKKKEKENSRRSYD